MADVDEQEEDSGAWLDWPRALAIVDHDLRLLERLVDVFLAQYGVMPAELRAAAQARDWLLAGRRAHQLAGAAGAIGAVGLEAVARAALAALREAPAGSDGGMAEADACVEALSRRLDWVLARARAWRTREGGTG